MKYEIIGEPMPVVVCELAPGETMITEKGSSSTWSPSL
ncbi:AIM24 family protein [Intestinimonas massiliensis]|nr:AIM24 family protein [Intestinimonas massiliensis (ex Afouda et al. 2020)]MCQ4808339.1 AIM24 family protein [Intestinimonas massiliensis (ex Afouda et al. 2020)]